MGFLANAFGIGSSGENWVAEKAKLDETMTPEQVQQAMAQHNASLQGQGQLAQQLAAQGGMGKQNDVYGQQQGLVGQQQGILGQQQGLAGQLAQMAQGGGPNPALAQLQQATGQNVAQQAALMGSARGGSANAGLMARQAAQQGANIQQQAVGQGATMQAQQQLGAINALGQQQQAMGNTTGMMGNTMGQMGGMANQQVANQMAGTGALTSATAHQQAQRTGGLQQQNAQRVQNISQANSAQAGIEQVAARGEQDTRAGIFSSLGLSFGKKAFGGEVETPQTVISPLAQDSGGGGGGGGPDIGQIMKLAAVAMADGGKVPTSYYGGSQQEQSQRAQSAQSGVMKAAQDNPISKAMAWLSKSEGGPIPGQAKVNGDSYSNDTVPTMLSPGEIVVPRSKANDSDEASKFVRNIIDKKPNSYKGFEKVNSTDHATTLRNQAGHQIMIAHGALSPEHREMIDALPHYYQGGQQPEMLPGDQPVDQPVEQDKPVAPGFLDTIIQSQVQGGGSPTSMAGGMEGSRSPQGNVMDSLNKQFDARDAARDETDKAMMAQQYGGTQKVGFEMPMTTASPVVESSDPYTKIMNQAQRGLDMQAKAEQHLADEKVKIAQESLDFQTLNQSNYAKERSTLDVERAQRLKDFNSAKVNPNDYWESKTSGQKVRNTIGMILSGFGGMQSVKMFTDSMDKEIDQNIKAQESNLGQKKTLLEENLRKYGDLDTARAATKIQHADFVLAQLDKAAASNPEAMAKSEIAKAQINAQLQPQIEAFAQKAAIMKSMGQTGSGGDPSVLAMIKPKEVQEKIAEDINHREELRSLKVGMMRSFKQLSEMQSAGTLSPNDADSARRAFTGPMQKLFEGRYNEDAVNKIITSLLPERGDMGDTPARKLGRIEQLFEGYKKGSISKMNGIDLDNYDKTSLKIKPIDLLEPADQARAKWALNNRNNPTAQRTIKALGLK